LDVNRRPKFQRTGLIQSLAEIDMHTSTVILPTARRLDLRVRFPAREPFAVLTSAWQRWQTRRAASALRRRALELLATQPGLAADFAAAAGCTLDDLMGP
jgi:hypothetical protein